jgi:riboflavin synthase
MFTGLVESVGTVRSLEERGDQACLTIALPFASELQSGDSVAVNGCCLTVTNHDDATASFDVLTQTLKVTSLGELTTDSRVNLERALAADGRLGGHFMQGHVDATGSIADLSAHGQDHRFQVTLPPEVERYCISKGSLAVDGISLTIAELEASLATFWITPHTFQHTNLHALSPGSTVNLEADLLAKYTEKLLQRR